MPHVKIKHFPKELDAGQRARLVEKVTEAIQEAFDVEEGVVSIALEPVSAEAWDAEVYQPEIVARRHLLVKNPSY